MHITGDVINIPLPKGRLDDIVETPPQAHTDKRRFPHLDVDIRGHSFADIGKQAFDTVMASELLTMEVCHCYQCLHPQG